MTKLNPDWLIDLLKGKNPHNLILTSFKWGKNIIVYGSIIFLTILGIIAWMFGTLNLFFLIFQSVSKWGFSYEATASAMQQMEASAILLLDLYLLSVVLFIVAIGLYGIFVKGESERRRLPVTITKMSELERYLFGTIVAILLVSALNKILYPGETALMENVAAIGMICAVVLVISIYLGIEHSKDK